MPKEILILEPEQGRELLKQIIANVEQQEKDDFITELEEIWLDYEFSK